MSDHLNVTHGVDCMHGEACKIAQYIRQSERAAAEIATWPEWMQHNLKPPMQTVEVPEVVISDDTDGY